MRFTSLHFFILFSHTPLARAAPSKSDPDHISLKALTSQGNRFDVACRIIKACLVHDGIPTKMKVTGIFPGTHRDPFPKCISIDGAELPKGITGSVFDSELTTARFLLSTLNDMARTTKQDKSVPGLMVQNDEYSTNANEVFMNQVKTCKGEKKCPCIMLMEDGDPALSLVKHEGVNTLMWLQDMPKDAIIIIGDQVGIPVAIAPELLDFCNWTCMIGTKTTKNENKYVSYLGSHAIDILITFYASKYSCSSREGVSILFNNREF